MSRTDPGGSTGTSDPIFFFFFTYYIFYFCSWVLPPKTLALLLSNQPSQLNPISNHSTQKINENNKSIHNDDFILVKKLFYHQRTKKSCVIGEVKVKFFQLQ